MGATLSKAKPRAETKHSLSRVVWNLTIFNSQGRKVAGPEPFDTHEAANQAGYLMREHPLYAEHFVTRSEERLFLQ